MSRSIENVNVNFDPKSAVSVGIADVVTQRNTAACCESCKECNTKPGKVQNFLMSVKFVIRVITHWLHAQF
jgi:hypothetical protein